MLIDLDAIRARAAKRAGVANSAKLRIDQGEVDLLQAEARAVLRWTDDDVADWMRDLDDKPQCAIVGLRELLAFCEARARRPMNLFGFVDGR